MKILVGQWLYSLAVAGMILFFMAAGASTASADEVSFLVDPDVFDTNMDGFITGTEFVTAGTDGTVFTFEPTNNFVGSDRLLLSPSNGLHYGGGGGSTLSFDFWTDRDITLEQYTLSSNGFFLGNPDFHMLDGVTVLSANNTSNSAGDAYTFNGGTLDLAAGTVYSFEVQTSGAAIQAYMASWQYSASAIPEPASGIVLLGAYAILRRRRRN